MPKKPAKNAFFFFMLDYKYRAEKRGRLFEGGMKQVALEASPAWETLPASRKEYFVQKAKARKNDPRPNVSRPDEKRFNSQGISFAELKMRKDRAEEIQKQTNKFITQFVDEMSLDDFRHKFIYLIHVNVFCITDDGTYYPAEIGIVKFNMIDGVNSVFQRYVDPGEIARGYSYTVKEHSDITHRLTLNFVKSIEGTDDFHRLYSDIMKFLTEDETQNKNYLPPLFTMYDDVILNFSMSAVKHTLKMLWTHVNSPNDPDDDRWETVFKILPLPDFFCKFKNRCMAFTNPNTIAFPNVVLAKSELQKDSCHYELDSACKFHRDEDCVAHCSQSFVGSWAYIIRNHCADLIGIDIFAERMFVEKTVKSDLYLKYEDGTSTRKSEFWNDSSSEISDSFAKYDSSVDHKPDKVSSMFSPIKREEDLVKRERNDFQFDPSVKREKTFNWFSILDSVKKMDTGSEIGSFGELKKDVESRVSDACIKHERDDSCIKQEKLDGHIKQERSDVHIKQEKPDGCIKQEKPDGHMKEEKDNLDVLFAGSIMQEIDNTRNMCAKKEKDINAVNSMEPDVNSTNFIKEEKYDPGYAL